MANGFQAKSLMQGETAEIPIESLEGLPLDWMVADVQDKLQHLSQSLNWLERSLEAGGLILSRGGVYSPSTSLTLASKIMNEEGIAVRKHAASDKWFATYSDHLGDGEIARWSSHRLGDRYGPASYQVHQIKARFEHKRIEVAICQCYVARHRGEIVEVPAGLFNQLSA